MPCPHFKITIVKRSQGQSAVAGAAYQSGERLFSEYDQKTKFYNKKKELVHAEIMLPSHAPPGYADRQNLWNAVEAVENQWNSQLARRIVLALPREVPKDQYLRADNIEAFSKERNDEYVGRAEEYKAAKSALLEGLGLEHLFDHSHELTPKEKEIWMLFDRVDVAELLARDAFAKGAYMLGAEDREIMLK